MGVRRGCLAPGLVERLCCERQIAKDYFKRKAHRNVSLFLFKRLIAVVVGRLGSASQFRYGSGRHRGRCNISGILLN